MNELLLWFPSTVRCSSASFFWNSSTPLSSNRESELVDGAKQSFDSLSRWRFRKRLGAPYDRWVFGRSEDASDKSCSPIEMNRWEPLFSFTFLASSSSLTMTGGFHITRHLSPEGAVLTDTKQGPNDVVCLVSHSSLLERWSLCCVASDILKEQITNFLRKTMLLL